MSRFREYTVIQNLGLGCLGLLCGVLFIKLSGHGEKSHLILCSEYFLYQYAYETIEYRELLFYVIINRVPLFLLLFVGALSKYRKKITGGIIFACIFGFTYLLGTGILRYGIRALALVVGLMTPQILFYVQSAWLLLKRNIQNPLKNCIWGSGFFLLGLLSEVYINPRWLHFLLGLF